MTLHRPDNSNGYRIGNPFMVCVMMMLLTYCATFQVQMELYRPDTPRVNMGMTLNYVRSYLNAHHTPFNTNTMKTTFSEILKAQTLEQVHSSTYDEGVMWQLTMPYESKLDVVRCFNTVMPKAAKRMAEIPDEVGCTCVTACVAAQECPRYIRGTREYDTWRCVTHLLRADAKRFGIADLYLMCAQRVAQYKIDEGSAAYHKMVAIRDWLQGKPQHVKFGTVSEQSNSTGTLANLLLTRWKPKKNFSRYLCNIFETSGVSPASASHSVVRAMKRWKNEAQKLLVDMCCDPTHTCEHEGLCVWERDFARVSEQSLSADALSPDESDKTPESWHCTKCGSLLCFCFCRTSPVRISNCAYKDATPEMRRFTLLQRARRRRSYKKTDYHESLGFYWKRFPIAPVVVTEQSFSSDEETDRETDIGSDDESSSISDSTDLDLAHEFIDGLGPPAVELEGQVATNFGTFDLQAVTLRAKFDLEHFKSVMKNVYERQRKWFNKGVARANKDIVETSLKQIDLDHEIKVLFGSVLTLAGSLVNATDGTTMVFCVCQFLISVYNQFRFIRVKVQRSPVAAAVSRIAGLLGLAWDKVSAIFGDSGTVSEQSDSIDGLLLDGFSIDMCLKAVRTLRGAFKNESGVGSDLITRFREGYLRIVALTMGIEKFGSFFEFAKSPSGMPLVGIMMSDSLTMLERGLIAYKLKDPGLIFVDAGKYEEIFIECLTAITYWPYYQKGTTPDLAGVTDGDSRVNMDYDEFVTYLKELKTRTELIRVKDTRLLRSAVNGSLLVVFRQIDTIVNGIVAAHLAETPRVLPWNVGLYGTPGVGKSFLTAEIQNMYLAKFMPELKTREQKASVIYTMVAGTKFMDNYQANKKIIVLDDFAAQHPDKEDGERNSCEMARQIMGINWFLTPQADLADKGAHPCRSECCILTTNSVDMHAHIMLAEPGAFYRRINLMVEVLTKDGNQFDASNLAIGDPSQWRYRFWIWRRNEHNDWERLWIQFDETQPPSIEHDDRCITWVAKPGKTYPHSVFQRVILWSLRGIEGQRSLTRMDRLAIDVCEHGCTFECIFCHSTEDVDSLYTAVGEQSDDPFQFGPFLDHNGSVDLTRTRSLVPASLHERMKRSIANVRLNFVSEVRSMQLKMNKIITSAVCTRFAKVIGSLSFGLGTAALVYSLAQKRTLKDEAEKAVATVTKVKKEINDLTVIVEQGNAPSSDTDEKPARTDNVWEGSQLLFPPQSFYGGIRDDDLGQLAHSHTAFLCTESGFSTGIACITGNIWVAPNHFFRKVYADAPRTTRFSIKMNGFAARTIEVPHGRVWSRPDVDIAYVFLTVPSRTSLERHALPETQLKEAFASPHVARIIGSDRGEAGFKFDTITRTPMQMLIRDDGVRLDASRAFPYIRNGEGPYMNICGSLLWVKSLSDANRFKVVGMHIWGDKSEVGFAMSITQEMIASARDHFSRFGSGSFEDVPVTEQVYNGVDLPKLSLEPHRRSNLRWQQDVDRATYRGTFDLPVFTSKSAVSDTPIAEGLIEHYGEEYRRFAPDLRSWRPIDLMYRQSLIDAPCIDSEILSQAAGDYFSGLDRTRYVEVLDRTQAVFGIPDRRFINSINFSTSCGFPLSGKKRLYLEEDYRDGRWVSSEIMCAVDQLEKQYRAGKRGSVFFKACLKDEPVSLKKLQKHKTRVFTGCPFAYQILFRKFYLPLIEVVQENNLEWECAIGANPRSRDWTEFRSHIIGVANDTNCCIDGDFSAYDKRMSPQLLHYAFDILIDYAMLCGYKDEDKIVMQGLAHDIIYANVIVQNDVMIFPAMHVSGEPATAVINSIVNSLLMRSVYFDQGLPGPFRDHVGLLTYGDDNVMGVNEMVRDKFNFQTLHRVLGSYGIEYTPADKSDALTANFRSIDQISFLKRTWVRYEGGIIPSCYLAPLDKKSIIGPMITWLRSASITKDAQLCATFYSCLTEMVAYGEEDYYEFYHTVLDLLPSDTKRMFFGTYIYTATYESMFERVYTFPERSGIFENGGCPASCEYVTEQSSAPRPNYSKMASNSIKTNDDDLAGHKVSMSNTLEQDMSVGESQQENVTFFDASPSVNVKLASELDATYSMAKQSDAQLGEFLGRPLKIWDYEWASGTVPTFGSIAFNPWTLFFQNAAVKEKINYFRLLRCVLHVKFVINGNRFLYGSAQMAYLPRDSNDRLATAAATAAVQWSQLPHVWLDPSTNQAGELELPFIQKNNWLDVTKLSDFEEMGKMYLNIYAGLKTVSSAGTVGTVDIACYAWAEQVEMCVPTPIVSLQMYGGPETSKKKLKDGKGDEYGVVSGPAAVLSRVATSLITVPILAPYAMATKIAADGIGGIARLFGFSRPIALENETRVVRQRVSGAMAYSTSKDLARKLTFDPKQELTVDSRVVGMNGADELSFASFCSRETYLRTTTWNQSDAPDAVVTSIPVTPNTYVRALDAGSNYEHVYMPAGYIGRNFRYWRGTMHYRFRIVASAFHRGRLKITFVPHVVTTLAADKSNIAYSTILDLEDSRDVTFCVPWATETPFKEKRPYMLGDPVSPNDDSCNGTVIITVINRLSAPATLAPVEIQTFAFMTEPVFREPFSFVNDGLALNPTELAAGMMVTEQSDEQIVDTNQTIASDHRMLMKPTEEIDASEAVWFGDPIDSIRSMMKRYSYYRTTAIPVSYAANEYQSTYAIRWTFPHAPQYGNAVAAGGGDYNDPTYAGTGGNVRTGRDTIIALFGACFLQWRGGIRHKFVLEPQAQNTGHYWYVTRFAGAGPSYGSDLVSAAPGNVREISIDPFGPAMWAGGDLMTTGSVLNILEAEMPFYSNKRYGNPRNPDNVDDSAQHYRITCLVRGDGGTNRFMVFRDFVAIGEDFNLSCFLYIPVLRLAP